MKNISKSYLIVFLLGFAGMIYILGWTSNVHDGMMAASGYFFGAAALWTFMKYTRRKLEKAMPPKKHKVRFVK